MVEWKIDENYQNYYIFTDFIMKEMCLQKHVSRREAQGFLRTQVDDRSSRRGPWYAADSSHLRIPFVFTITDHLPTYFDAM